MSRISDSQGVFPTYAEFVGQLNGALARQDLSPRGQLLARAFAKAIYRRSLARRLRVEVEHTVVEAVEMATKHLRLDRAYTATRSTYAYQSGRAGTEGRT